MTETRPLPAWLEQDLPFIVATCVTHRQDLDHVQEFLRAHPDLLDDLLSHDRLFDKIQSDEQVFLRITPQLFFTVLMRHMQKALSGQAYTLEITASGERVPVFDTGRVHWLLQQRPVQEYLASLLSSFSRVESTTVVYRRRGYIYKHRHSDLDWKALAATDQLLDDRHRFMLYRRLGDLALFLTGMFPDFVISGRASGGAWRSRNTDTPPLEEFVAGGRHYYELAASHADAASSGLTEVLQLLADNFVVARKLLNILADDYVGPMRERWFAGILN
ncbi:MAG: hypothetical protein IMW99_03535 [Firmicutes bacterium]|nr:hypothetical protein [Bacillota bacterium]